MSLIPSPEVYQLRIRLSAISPLIWRRLLVRSDTSIAALHHLIQHTFGWTDSHLHRFVIHGKAYGIAYAGGISFIDDPQQVGLADFCFRRTAAPVARRAAAKATTRSLFVRFSTGSRSLARDFPPVRVRPTIPDAVGAHERNSCPNAPRRSCAISKPNGQRSCHME